MLILSLQRLQETPGISISINPMPEIDLGGGMKYSIQPQNEEAEVQEQQVEIEAPSIEVQVKKFVCVTRALRITSFIEGFLWPCCLTRALWIELFTKFEFVF